MVEVRIVAILAVALTTCAAISTESLAQSPPQAAQVVDVRARTIQRYRQVADALEAAGDLEGATQYRETAERLQRQQFEEYATLTELVARQFIMLLPPNISDDGARATSAMDLLSRMEGTGMVDSQSTAWATVRGDVESLAGDGLTVSEVQAFRESAAELHRSLTTQQSRTTSNEPRSLTGLGGALSRSGPLGAPEWMHATNISQAFTGDTRILRCIYRADGGYTFSVDLRATSCPGTVEVNPETREVR